MFTLLQVVGAVQDAAAEKISLLSLLEKGGWLMYPLYLLLAIALFIFFERFLFIRKTTKLEESFMPMIREYIYLNNISAANTLATNTPTPAAKMIAKGIKRMDKPVEVVEKTMEGVGRQELYLLEKNLNILALIAGIAPMFGFLGTIIGMVQLFYEINSTGNFDLSTIAGGIYVKMITSATGLIIGLIAYIFHNYLSTQVDKVANKMEVTATDFIDILQEKKQ